LQVPKTQKEEEGDLEDISLDEPKPAPQKKRGMLSRIMDSDSHSQSERPSSHDGTGKASAWHHFGGRKRGQSGQGAELGSIPKKDEVGKPMESQLSKESTKPVENTLRKEVPRPVEGQLRKEETPKIVETLVKKDDTPEPTESKVRSTEVPSQPQALPKPDHQTPQATAGAQKENSQAPVITNGVS